MPALIIFIYFILLLILRGLFNLDLFPILIVYLAVKNSPEATVFWSALFGIFEDALFFPNFLHLLSYTIIGGLALYLKEIFALEEDDLILTLVVILTPVSILLTAMGFWIFRGKIYPDLLFSLIKATVINGVTVFLLNFFIWRNR